MADTRTTATPPQNLSGISRPGRGMQVVKPKNLKGTLKRLWDLTTEKRKGLGLVLLFSAFSSATAIISPRLTGSIITHISEGDTITTLLLLLAGLYVCDWFVKFMQQFLMAAIGQRIINHIRQELFGKIKNLPLRFFDKHQHGELMSRLTNDVDNISTTISSSITLLMTYSFTIVGIFTMMVMLSPILTLVTLCSVFMIFVLTKVVTKHTRKLFREQQKNLGILNGQIEEGISGLTVVKAFGREKQMEEDFDRKNENLTKTAIRALIWSGYLMPLMNVINNICYLAIAVISGLLYINGNLSDIGLISTFLLYSRQFTRPFVEIANVYNNLQTAVAGAERVFEIMDQEPEPVDKPDAKELTNTRGEVEFRNVSFGYDPGKTILKDISLKIPAGKKVAIVGPTGSGKTTIINLLTRFYDVTSGSIYLDGTDLRDYRMGDLRNVFGVVLQDTALFAESVKDNIAYGKEGATLDSIKEAARAAGADAFIERLPNGYDTVLEQGGMELSQGERQLLTIARAVLSNAPIMILDEATSSVDTVTEQKIRNAMLKICENRTSFIIAHRLSTIRDSDIIILIENGRIAEKGSHDELITLNGKYAEMYRTQVG